MGTYVFTAEGTEYVPDLGRNVEPGETVESDTELTGKFQPTKKTKSEGADA